MNTTATTDLITRCANGVTFIENALDKDPSAFDQGSLTSIVKDVFEAGHKLNRAAGWWHDLQTGEPLTRNIGELLMLVVSEIVEAQEGGKQPDKHLPEFDAFTVESADALIRLADLAGSHFCRSDVVAYWVARYVRTRGLRTRHAAQDHADGFKVVSYLSSALEAARKGIQDEIDARIAQAIFGVVNGARSRDMNYRSLACNDERTSWAHSLAEPLRKKLVYNVSRPDHRRETRLSEGGKRF